jgi:site-specific DNA-methyltransferase (adenine-specific)
MKPYYQDQWTTIYHGDCRKLLLKLEPVDLIVTDAAYEGISGGNTTDTRRCSGILSVNDGKIFDYNDIKTAEYASLFYHVLKDPAHCYVMINNLNLEEALRDFREAGFGLHNVLPWIKNNATPNRWFMKDVELILMFRKGAAFSINDCSEKASCFYRNPTNKLHETEKPVPLLQKLIRASSQPGDVVLDPFMGSGSTLEAAKRLGRRSIGIDIDEKYCQVAAQRMALCGEFNNARTALKMTEQLTLA